MSGVDFDGRSIRKGASDAIAKYVASHGDPYRSSTSGLPAEVRASVDDVAKKGATPLVVADGGKVLGVVQLADSRVARARNVPVVKIEAIIDRNTSERTLGVLGERRVNVVRLNKALDQEVARPKS